MSIIIKTNSTLKKQKRIINKIEIYIFILFIVLLITLSIFYFIERNNNKQLSNELTKSIQLNQKQYKEVNKLEKELKVLNIDYNNYQVLKQRKELYDEYSYVLFDEYGNKTDITYELLEYGINLMENRNIDPDLLFGFIMIESRGREKVDNPISSARGFCQIIEGTAKSIYQNKLNKGQYIHTMAYDGKINMEIGSELLASNMEKYNGDTYTTVQRYTGQSSPDIYYSKLNKCINRGGTNLHQIGLDYKNKNI